MQLHPSLRRVSSKSKQQRGQPVGALSLDSATVAVATSISSRTGGYELQRLYPMDDHHDDDNDSHGDRTLPTCSVFTNPDGIPLADLSQADITVRASGRSPASPLMSRSADDITPQRSGRKSWAEHKNPRMVWSKLTTDASGGKTPVTVTPTSTSKVSSKAHSWTKSAKKPASQAKTSSGQQGKVDRGLNSKAKSSPHLKSNQNSSGNGDSPISRISSSSSRVHLKTKTVEVENDDSSLSSSSSSSSSSSLDDVPYAALSGTPSPISVISSPPQNGNEGNIEVIALTDSPSPTRISPWREHPRSTTPLRRRLGDLDETLEDESSISVGDATSFNMPDGYLMGRSESPGTLRLTTEGLRRHEQITLQQAIMSKKEKQPKSSSSSSNNPDVSEPPSPPTDGFTAWQQSRDVRKFYRQKHEEKHGRLVDQNIRLREESSRRTLGSRLQELPPIHGGTILEEHDDEISEAKRSVFSTLSSRLIVLKGGEDVADLSLAPMQTLEGLTLNDINSSRGIGGDIPAKTKKPNKLLSLFRRKKPDPAEMARKLLEKERQAYVEMQRQKKLEEQEEMARIERKRQAYLEQQRSREMGAALPPQRPRLLTAATEESQPDVSTMSSSRSPTLPPCVVCGNGIRTHIATPCMHFSFCESCVDELRVRSTCPVCHSKNVSFASVCV